MSKLGDHLQTFLHVSKRQLGSVVESDTTGRDRERYEVDGQLWDVEKVFRWVWDADEGQHHREDYHEVAVVAPYSPPNDDRENTYRNTTTQRFVVESAEEAAKLIKGKK